MSDSIDGWSVDSFFHDATLNCGLAGPEASMDGALALVSVFLILGRIYSGREKGPTMHWLAG
jgi:hypothetical protein